MGNRNLAWKCMKSYLEKVFDNHAPYILKRVKGKKISLAKSRPQIWNESSWLSLEETNRKSKLPSDFKRFQAQRNKVTLVRKVKAQYNQDLLKDSVIDPNRFWSAIKKIFPTKEHISTAKTFLVDNKLTTNTEEIASGFCSFFYKWRINLAKAAPLKDFVWGKPRETIPKTYPTFKFRKVKVQEVSKYLKNPVSYTHLTLPTIHLV